MKNGIKILLASDSLINLGLGLIGPIYAIFVAQIGGDILDASWAYFAYMFTSGFLMYILSFWEDRIKHKEKLVTIGYLITAFGCLGYLFVNDQISLLVVQVILGIAAAILSPAFDAIFSHYTEEEKEASNWGAWEALGFITTAFSALIGGYIAEFYGFKVVFILMAILSIIGALISFNLLRDKEYLNSHKIKHSK